MSILNVNLYPNRMYAAFGMPKFVPWHEDIDRILHSLVDAGIVNQLIRSYIKPKYLIKGWN